VTGAGWMVPVSTRPFSILKMESNSTYKLESLGAKHNLKKPLVSIIWSTVWLGLNRHDQTSTHSRDTHRRPKQHLHERETWGTSEFIEFTYTGWVQGDFQEQGLPPMCCITEYSHPIMDELVEDALWSLLSFSIYSSPS